MNRAIFRRRHHPLIWMAVLLPLLLGLDVLAWLLWAAWHLLPYVLAIGVAVVAC